MMGVVKPALVVKLSMTKMSVQKIFNAPMHHRPATIREHVWLMKESVHAMRSLLELIAHYQDQSVDCMKLM